MRPVCQDATALPVLQMLQAVSLVVPAAHCCLAGLLKVLRAHMYCRKQNLGSPGHHPPRIPHSKQQYAEQTVGLLSSIFQKIPWSLHTQSLRKVAVYVCSGMFEPLPLGQPDFRMRLRSLLQAMGNDLLNRVNMDSEDFHR